MTETSVCHQAGAGQEGADGLPLAARSHPSRPTSWLRTRSEESRAGRSRLPSLKPSSNPGTCLQSPNQKPEASSSSEPSGMHGGRAIPEGCSVNVSVSLRCYELSVEKWGGCPCRAGHSHQPSYQKGSFWNPVGCGEPSTLVPLTLCGNLKPTLILSPAFLERWFFSEISEALLKPWLFLPPDRELFCYGASC